MAWDKRDLSLLCRYAAGRKFIMETGGGGLSTKRLAKIARSDNGIMVSIEVDSNRVHNIEGVDHQIGWSITYDDILKKGDEEFIENKNNTRYHYADRDVAMLGEEYMKGETDLIRKSIDKYGSPPDFFFCDTGEYCGIAEWNIIKEFLPVDGIFACHDIYYPKSAKCFQVVKKIEQSEQWKVLKKTPTKQGLFVAKRIA
jgi:hypothetical protein